MPLLQIGGVSPNTVDSHYHDVQGDLWKYREDIYSFAVNTINIFIKCNENISIFTSAKHKRKFECFHYTR